MKKTLALVSTLALLLGALPAWAYPTYAPECSACHPQDPAVVVTLTPAGCYQGNEAFVLNVSNTNPGLEGTGVFDGPTKIQGHWGNYATFMLPSQKSYTFYGVSGFGSTSSLTATSNSVGYASNCPPQVCVDADSDGYSVTGGACGPVDCNDAIPTVHPGAVEIVRDGVDQDCNGYDLTILVTKATYSTRTKKLTVEASSLYGATANLTVAGFGPMTWSSKTQRWTLTVVTSANPGTVTVSGFEGSVVSAVTTVR